MEFDHTKIKDTATHLSNAVINLINNSDEVARAAVVKDFVSTRRDNILAKFSNPFIIQGKSKAVAEVMARNNPEYHQELEALIEQATEAEKILRKDKAMYAAYEANRSLLSLSKAIKDQLQG